MNESVKVTEKIIIIIILVLGRVRVRAEVESKNLIVIAIIRGRKMVENIALVKELDINLAEREIVPRDRKVFEKHNVRLLITIVITFTVYLQP